MSADKKTHGRWKKMTAAAAISVAGMLVVMCGVYASMFRYQNPLAGQDLPPAFTGNGALPGDVLVDGKTYRYNDDMLNILLIGYDQTRQREKQGIGYQSDMLILLTLDRKSGEVKLVSIPRDTRTEIAVADVWGNYSLTEQKPIAMSRAYGMEDKIGNDLAMAAVGNLLYRVPVTRYVALNIDGIGALNDAVGGVTLQLAADFTMFDPEMKQGAMYTLRGDEAELYVRSRQIPGMSGQDSDRMERQAQYLSVFCGQALAAVKEDPGALNALMGAAEGNMETNLTKLELLYLVRMLRGAASALERVERIPGAPEGDVFIADDAALKQLVLDTFFVQMGG